MTDCPLDRMERIMKHALASSNQLTLEHAKTLGIGEWAFTVQSMKAPNVVSILKNSLSSVFSNKQSDSD